MVRTFLLFILCMQTCFAVKQEQIVELSQETTDFSIALYSTLAGNDNCLCSPYSIFQSLSMVYVGSREKTAEEFQKTLFLTFSQNKIPAVAVALMQTLKVKNPNPHSYQLNVANALWVDRDTFILSDFRHSVEKDYETKVQDLNFKKVEESSNIINEWTSNQTQGKIPRLIHQEEIDPLTRLLLTNAVYFKGTWISPFDIKNTQEAPFYPTLHSSISVPMMQQKAPFLYGETDLCQIVALPFEGKTTGDTSIALVVLLPKEEIPLVEVERSLTRTLLKESIDHLKLESLHVTLPRFEMTKRFNLNETLQKMGLVIAFSNKADFSGINGMRDLYLSQVFHEAFFSLNESGVTAAAATGSALSMTAMPEKKPSIEFTADHPFLFLIVDLMTKMPLFMGKYVQPQ
jgi:serpin B